jgi:hypothetical protein
MEQHLCGQSHPLMRLPCRKAHTEEDGSPSIAITNVSSARGPSGAPGRTRRTRISNDRARGRAGAATARHSRMQNSWMGCIPMGRRHNSVHRNRAAIRPLLFMKTNPTPDWPSPAGLTPDRRDRYRHRGRSGFASRCRCRADCRRDWRPLPEQVKEQHTPDAISPIIGMQQLGHERERRHRQPCADFQGRASRFRHFEHPQRQQRQRKGEQHIGARKQACGRCPVPP